jgi:hypothetical protein
MAKAEGQNQELRSMCSFDADHAGKEPQRCCGFHDYLPGRLLLKNRMISAASQSPRAAASSAIVLSPPGPVRNSVGRGDGFDDVA